MKYKNSFFSDVERHIMEQNNISNRIAYDRVTKSGWDRERAILAPVRVKVDSGWTMYKHIALSNGIDHATYWRRWKKGYLPEICLLSKDDFNDYISNE